MLTDNDIYTITKDLLQRYSPEQFSGATVGLINTSIGGARGLELLDVVQPPIPTVEIITKKKLPELPADPETAKVAAIGQIIVWLNHRNRTLKSAAADDPEKRKEINRENIKRRWEKAQKSH